METNIKIFSNPDFGQIRTITMPDGQVGFVGKDVAKVLGYANPQKAIRDHVDEEDKTVNGLFTVNGTAPVLINESGLYALILASKLPKAREFKHWVTSEVLPQIRQTGGYIPLDEADNENTILRKALTICERTVEQQNKQLAEQKPKVAFAEMVMASNDLCSVAVLAKMLASNGIKIGQVRLFRWMREHHYLGNCEPHWNVAHQRWIERGLFRLKVSPPWYDWNGNPRYRVTSLITGKGQKYFINLFIRNNN